MASREKALVVTVLAIGLALVVAQGCGKGAESFELSGQGFSMKLPPGWEQGEPRASGGYRPSSRGPFFESADRDDSSGDVMEMPLLALSLTESVDNVVKQTEAMESLHLALARTLDKVTGGAASEELKEAESSLESSVVSRRAFTIGDLEAIEVVTEPRAQRLLSMCAEGTASSWSRSAHRRKTSPSTSNCFETPSEPYGFADVASGRGT